MSNLPLISILIPCYNTEKYLAKCLKSICNQTYTNIEILIINDGSKDSSLEIMQEFASKDSRIHIVSRENKGVAYSRNEAIEKASGEFILFVDSDDTINSQYTEILYKNLIENDADISMCGVKNVYSDENIDTNFEVCAPQVLTSDEAIYNLIVKGSYYDYPVAKLMRKSVVSSVQFPLGRIYEDTSTMFKFYNVASKTVVTKSELYYYLIGREESITTKKYTLKNVKDNYLAVKDRHDYIKEHNKSLTDTNEIAHLKYLITLIKRAYLSNDNEVMESKYFKDSVSEALEIADKYSGQPKYMSILSDERREIIQALLNNNATEYFEKNK